MNNKVAQIITDRIMEMVEKDGVLPWQKPFNTLSGMPRNGTTEKPYRGINLWMTALSPFSNPYWFTYNQVKAMGGHVKKSEVSTPVVYWNFVKKPTGEIDDMGNEIVTRIPFMRYYNVFNAEQCEGLPEKYTKPAETKNNDPIAEAQKIIDNMPMRPIINEGNAGYYTPSLDTVTLPPMGSFTNSEAFYCVAFHELAHSTGHKTRLNRKTITEVSPFGSANYGSEELVAEFAASFLCGVAGISEKVIDNSASYIKSWKEKIKADPTLLVYSAQKASKATDFILGVKEEIE
jgi:antirestriction protein ArdC